MRSGMTFIQGNNNNNTNSDPLDKDHVQDSIQTLKNRVPESEFEKILNEAFLRYLTGEEAPAKTMESRRELIVLNSIGDQGKDQQATEHNHLQEERLESGFSGSLGSGNTLETPVRTGRLTPNSRRRLAIRRIHRGQNRGFSPMNKQRGRMRQPVIELIPADPTTDEIGDIEVIQEEVIKID